MIANVTQVSWKKALGVFEARLATVSPEHGTKLQRWKKSVAEVYSDFSAKLPDAELPTQLATKAESEDGCTEGSRRQDLMLPGTKQQ